MKLVVLDGHTVNPGDNPWEPVAALGDLTVYDRTAEAEVLERAGDAEVVITNKTRLPATVIDALPALRLICVLATGYDVVDVAAACRRGVVVCNVPEYGTDSVAQHVFALLLELVHRMADHDAAVRAGAWSRAPDFCFWLQPPVELAGLAIGIVGYGRIGRRVADIARAFGMHVLAAGRAPLPGAAERASQAYVEDAADQIEWVSRVDLFARADVVSLHCPLTAQTERMVDAAMLARMKPTAFLINTARGRLLDEAALAGALRAGKLAGAGLDVSEREPMAADSPLLGAPRCVITPHMAWASLAARKRLMRATAANIAAFAAGRPIHVVEPL